MASDWINSSSKDKPWLCMIGHKAPHSFYFPEPKYEHTFDKVRIPYPETAFHLEDKPKWIQQRLNTWHGIYGPLFDYRKKFPDSSPEAVKDFEAMIRSYWGTILSVDDSVGQLVKLLKDRGELDNTLIVFMGDNGLLNGEHGMVDKRTMHEPSIRIPLVVRYPALTKVPKIISEMVVTVDMAPSILELCEARPMENIHGKSWVKLVRQGDDDWRKSYLYHYNYEKQFPYTPNVRGVRTNDWKYVHYPHGDGKPDRHLAELYDLKNDPSETKNLIANPNYAAKVQELKNELERLKKQLGLEKDTMPLDEGIGTALPDAKIR
jgi:N-acetylglucosamine-6-sulfatase